MKILLTAALSVVCLATVATTASAQPYRHGYGHERHYRHHYRPMHRMHHYDRRHYR